MTVCTQLRHVLSMLTGVVSCVLGASLRTKRKVQEASIKWALRRLSAEDVMPLGCSRGNGHAVQCRLHRPNSRLRSRDKSAPRPASRWWSDAHLSAGGLSTTESLYPAQLSASRPWSARRRVTRFHRSRRRPRCRSVPQRLPHPHFPSRTL
jgi:hypothetical protein